MDRPETPQEALARKRLMVISAARFAGVLLILGGILAANDALPFSVPPVIAYIVVGIGMVETFAIPILLSRRWSTNSRR